MSTETLRIVVLGYVVRGPLGGMVWSNLQYLQGLARLGHEVLFVEDSDDYPSCYDPTTDHTSTDPRYGVRFATDAFDRIGLGNRWCYVDAHTGRLHGPAGADALARAGEADVLLDLCGVNPWRDWMEQVPVRVLVDEDPGFTQLRHLRDDAALAHARRHTSFFTFGENIANGTSSVPPDGITWMSTRQPVVLDTVTVSPPRPDAAFTTVMQWRSYEALTHEGVRYGQKAESFEPYADLPRRTVQRLEIAAGAPDDVVRDLRDRGWAVRDPRPVTVDVDTYEAYVRASKAELSVAKEGYVAGRTGWFSERSVTYLATGRPVVVQDTGFTEWLPAGVAVLAFDDADGAVDAIEKVSASYDEHAGAAREVAREHFDAATVLTRLLERAR